MPICRLAIPVLALTFLTACASACRDRGGAEGTSAARPSADPSTSRGDSNPQRSAESTDGAPDAPDARTEAETEYVAHARPPAGAVRPVTQVDLERYMGWWYEIARLPNSFQDGIVGVQIEYTLEDDGKIDVHNRGYKRKLGGPISDSHATAWVVNGSANTKWHVQFIWPFKADYWIIELDTEYRWAVVGQPGRDYLWIICREPRMPADVYEQLLERIKRHGYNPSKLERTPQPEPKTEDQSDNASEE